MPSLHMAQALVACHLVVGLAAAQSSVSSERFQFISPQPQELLLGSVDIRFSVSEGTPAVDQIDVYVNGALIGAATAPDWSFGWEVPPDIDELSMSAIAFGLGRSLGLRRLRTAPHHMSLRMEVVAVQLYPVVRRGSRYVGDLNADDFIVLDQGEVVEIDSFSHQPATLSVALVLDVSASMEDKLAFVQQASVRFLEQLDDADEVSVYAFNHALAAIVAPTTDHRAGAAAVLELTSGGGTAIYDAIRLVLEDLHAIAQRKVILLFSDGEDERSLTSLRRAADAARDVEAIIYAVGTVSPGAQPRQDLRVLAEETGGAVHFVDDLGRLPAVFDKIMRDVKAQYALSFTPRVGPAGVRKLEVRTTNPRLSVSCRKSYVYDPG